VSIFSRPLSQIETADLQELLSEGAAENVRLEFKSLVPNKEETLKKLSSFANTLGGFMIVGAMADGVDGRIQGLPSVDMVPRYKQKVVQWCFDAVSPSLTVEVSDPIPAPEANGKVCYVIYAPESETAPHFLNGRRGVWVRADEFSARFEAQLANESEFRHLFDRRKLVQERRAYLLGRARRRFDTYSAKKHTDRGGHRAKSGPLLELCIAPRFPTRQLCEQERLKGYVQNNWLNWRQVTFPDIGSPILSQHESAIVLSAARGISIFEINIWGMLFYAAELDTNHSEFSGIHLFQFVGYVLAFIAHAGKMLRAMGYSGPVYIETSIGAILETPWLWDGGYGPSSKPGSELDDGLAFSIPIMSDDLCEKPDRIAMDILRNVLFSVNSSDLVDTQPKLESILRIGYKYNFWPVPDSLRT